jgi:hypothetical protein
MCVCSPLPAGHELRTHETPFAQSLASGTKAGPTGRERLAVLDMVVGEGDLLLDAHSAHGDDELGRGIAQVLVSGSHGLALDMGRVRRITRQRLQTIFDPGSAAGTGVSCLLRG